MDEWTSAGGWRGWALRRALRRAVRGGPGGRLLWALEDGSVVDLGAYSKRDLATLLWAWNVAYRQAGAGDKGRLATAREAQARLTRGLAALPQEGKDGKA